MHEPQPPRYRDIAKTSKFALVQSRSSHSCGMKWCLYGQSLVRSPEFKSLGIGCLKVWFLTVQGDSFLCSRRTSRWWRRNDVPVSITVSASWRKFSSVTSMRWARFIIRASYVLAWPWDGAISFTLDSTSLFSWHRLIFVVSYSVLGATIRRRRPSPGQEGLLSAFSKQTFHPSWVVN